MFQKRHYERLASIIDGMDFWAPTPRETRNEVARQFADALARDNPRFDRERFLAACGAQTPEQNKRLANVR